MSKDYIKIGRHPYEPDKMKNMYRKTTREKTLKNQTAFFCFSMNKSREIEEYK